MAIRQRFPGELSKDDRGDSGSMRVQKHIYLEARWRGSIKKIIRRTFIGVVAIGPLGASWSWYLCHSMITFISDSSRESGENKRYLEEIRDLMRFLNWDVYLQKSWVNWNK